MLKLQYQMLEKLFFSKQTYVYSFRDFWKRLTHYFRRFHLYKLIILFILNINSLMKWMFHPRYWQKGIGIYWYWVSFPVKMLQAKVVASIPTSLHLHLYPLCKGILEQRPRDRITNGAPDWKWLKWWKKMKKVCCCKLLLSSLHIEFFLKKKRRFLLISFYTAPTSLDHSVMQSLPRHMQAFLTVSITTFTTLSRGLPHCWIWTFEIPQVHRVDGAGMTALGAAATPEIPWDSWDLHRNFKASSSGITAMNCGTCFITSWMDSAGLRVIEVFLFVGGQSFLAYANHSGIYRCHESGVMIIGFIFGQVKLKVQQIWYPLRTGPFDGFVFKTWWTSWCYCYCLTLNGQKTGTNPKISQASQAGDFNFVSFSPVWKMGRWFPLPSDKYQTSVCSHWWFCAKHQWWHESQSPAFVPYAQGNNRTVTFAAFA